MHSDDVLGAGEDEVGLLSLEILLSAVDDRKEVRVAFVSDIIFDDH